MEPKESSRPMVSNPYQPLVSLLSNILEAYTTAFFIFDPKNRQLNLAAVQSLSKFIPPDISLPLEGSGILSQVQKVGQTIHLDKLHEATSSISLTLPFYREGESHIKGLYAVPVAGGAAVLYVDTKYGWGFNDKQQKWINEFAELLGGLLNNAEAERRQEGFAKVFEVLTQLDEVAFKGYALDSYCELFVTEWAKLLGMDYGFLAFKEPGKKTFGTLGCTANTPRGPATQSFPVKQGLIGWILQNQKKLLIIRLNPDTSDHFLFSPGENLPHMGTIWGMPGQTSLGYELALVFLSRQVIDWDADSERAVAHAFHFLQLLLEQIYYKEENEALHSYDICTGLFSAPAFESRVEGLFHASMQSNAPFTLGLIQFEPWQILSTKVLPKRIRQLQRELASSLCDALPPGVLVGQLAENRFGVLFAETTVQEAESLLTELARYGKIALKGIKGVKLHPYMSSAGFPQDAAKIEELWPLVSQRLFSAFGLKPEKAVS
jgi:GGDEF domain-containing protein